MRTRALPIMTAVLGIAILPLAGCNRDISGVQAQKDEKGRTEVKVDREKVDQNLQEARKNLDSAGREIGKGVQEGAERMGSALEKGAKKFEAEVGPVAEEVLNDAGVTARVKATLNGKVASADQRAEAEKLARHTDGVNEVVNLIQVAGQPPPPGQPR